ncbi:hypothetical protein RFI_08607 [Reticulomyxa filosa]|uniref:Uncharacterized protein n=1 Tax=Reticulomyxa filosa TaxID=46433 RepID=X6NRG3_RETFI|nr:hypothetical protein RFI_08607 [Reticulomyxa filosa]|eukprot:ETO28523.1 hypothetical protein RFI_08607 [Reticulomyxa filosa]
MTLQSKMIQYFTPNFFAALLLLVLTAVLLVLVHLNAKVSNDNKTFDKQKKKWETKKKIIKKKIATKSINVELYHDPNKRILQATIAMCSTS